MPRKHKPGTFQIKGKFLQEKNQKKKLHSSYHGPEYQEGASIKDGLETTFFTQLYMKICRGLQLRNWKQTLKQLLVQRCPKDIIQALYRSWVKFKFARALRPRMSQTYVYILKHCSDLEGQKVYDDCYEQYTEQPYSTTKEFYEKRGRGTIYFRLMEYFYNEDPEWILPLSVFPRIDFEKSKMHLSMEPYNWDQDLEKELHELVFNYIMKQDIKKILVPRADLLQKYGNQRYNDGGVVKYDYERPTNSFDSSFKYQRFLTNPLTPREVWLPGKAIKQNNAFFMQIHRQFLLNNPTYPSIDMDENHSRIFEHLKDGFWKFDISGFGFQYLREALRAGNNAIRELYPCSAYEEQSEIFEEILNNVSVEMPNGEVVKPLRGIGLGYYEDLKTIVMLAILDKHFPIQVYGDQGLIEKRGIEFAFDLMKFQFLMNYEKLDEGSSEGRTRWGGYVFEGSKHWKPRTYTDSIFGSFFARHHWERKSALYSFYKHYPDVYKSIEKRICNFYNLTFGYEFFKGDVNTNFLNGGLSTRPRAVGHQRLYNIRSYMTPINLLVYDPMYQTPFNLISKNNIGFKESKLFQKKRKNLYKKNTINDTSLYDYCNPILEYNKKNLPDRAVLPRWADLNSILFNNQSGGAITAGLKGEEIMRAVERQTLASDPFRARATGGYSITTRWRTERPPSQEWIESAEILMECSDLDSMYVNRSDLFQNPALAEDPMYYDTDLFRGVIEKVRKRRRDELSDTDESLRDRLFEDIKSQLPSMIKKNKVTDLPSIIQLSEELLDGYDKGYTVAESNHGDYDADDGFYADAIDLVDLS